MENNKGRMTMNTDITIRHFEASERIKEYAMDEVNRLIKYHDRIVSCKMILDRTKEGEMAEINIHIAGKDFNSTQLTNDIFKSIDGAVDKMVSQLKKYVDRKFKR